MKYIFAEICLYASPARWDVYLLYRHVYVENMTLVSELYCYYICLLNQMWVSAVQDNNHDNKKKVCQLWFCTRPYWEKYIWNDEGRA